jgi:dihydrofolate synthase/folylpolyglutamate synthase
MHFDSLPGWLRWQEGLHPLAIDLGLERVAAVYDALNPQCLKPLTITVAGTNGKGSCVAYLEAFYKAQGYRVGAYTSPHILRYNERIKINGEPVSDELICAAFTRIEAVRAGHSLSYFEFGTLAALDIFWRSDLDIQLLEVGLGGRLDAVNIVDPDAAIVTSIGIDHVYWLGDTREAIGREKAGIFRPATPAIVSDLEPPASVIATAQAQQARLYCLNQQFHYSQQQQGWTWSAEGRQLDGLPEPALKGEHQYRNASAAILATQLLSERLPVGADAIRSGLANVRLAGRFQQLPGDMTVILDVGHNPEAVKTLVAYLKQYYPGRTIHAVFAMMKDKDIASVLDIMHPVVHDWYFAPLANHRAITETAMREIFLQSPVSKVSFGFSGFKDAFDAAKSQAHPDDVLLVFGSFFLVSDCLHEFEKSELTT